MKIEFLTGIKSNRQDGAIFGGYLFSFNHKGECTVYEIASLGKVKNGEAKSFSEFVLDKNEIIVPHSNSVMFGNEYYSNDDEFPLLYTNIYNNCADLPDKLKGVCLVYRLQRKEKSFSSTLVQLIEIGFVENENLWKSSGEKADVRPYGNFTIDTERGVYYAFTMRDNTNSTRYFSFRLPKVAEGEFCEKYNVKKVILNQSDILDFFDCEYHQYIQGACLKNGRIYSLEGFSDSVDNPPSLRIIDTIDKKQICLIRFKDYGLNIEPEMIDFEGDTCYYTDHNGNVYNLVNIFTDTE